MVVGSSKHFIQDIQDLDTSRIRRSVQVQVAGTLVEVEDAARRGDAVPRYVPREGEGLSRCQSLVPSMASAVLSLVLARTFSWSSG